MEINTIDTLVNNYSSSQGAESFLSMNHPLFYFLTLLLIGIITYYFNLRQKRKESIYSAKKEILKARIDIYNELYNLTSVASQIVLINTFQYGVKIFENEKDLDNWSDKFSAFHSKNWMYFTKETKKAIEIMRKFQQAYLPVKNKFKNKELLQFSNICIEDWMFITDQLRNSIEDFFNNKINFNQKFADLSDSEYKSVEKECSTMKILKELNSMK